MNGFNSKLKSKDELQKFTKEELIDMYWQLGENYNKFMEIIFNATQEEFKSLKLFYKLMNEEQK